MGQPVVHFEIIGKDGDALKAYYGELFGWNIDSGNPMDYGIVAREENLAPDGSGIGGGVAGGPPGYEGHLTFYVAVEDCEAALAKAADLGGTRVMGPDEIPGMGLTIGQLHRPGGPPRRRPPGDGRLALRGGRDGARGAVALAGLRVLVVGEALQRVGDRERDGRGGDVAPRPGRPARDADAAVRPPRRRR